MGPKSDRKRQRELAASAELERRCRARVERCPIDLAQFWRLIDYVSLEVDAAGHDSDRSHTLRWCEKEGVDAATLTGFLDGEGLADDWALVMNGDPYVLFGPADGRRARMPLERVQLEELIGYLGDELASSGCLHDHRLTTLWLESKKLDAPLTIVALMAQGGFCDCEVVYNVVPESIFLPTAH